MTTVVYNNEDYIGHDTSIRNIVNMMLADPSLPTILSIDGSVKDIVDITYMDYDGNEKVLRTVRVDGEV